MIGDDCWQILFWLQIHVSSDSWSISPQFCYYISKNLRNPFGKSHMFLKEDDELTWDVAGESGK